MEFIVDNYLSISNFELLLNYIHENTTQDEIYNKHLLITIIGCIEGNIQLELQNNSFHMYFNGYNIDGKDKIDCDNYILSSIYNNIKVNSDLNDFIIKYFDLWHGHNENSDFLYDKYHKDYLKENFQILLYAIKEDIKKAGNIKDNDNLNKYQLLLNDLIDKFCRN
ncbi:hypothetical protein [Sedimentibacter sp. MB31-C6]|uniref:hypothetical protein n=1 Tax=Sedimentibacter sp. MB31-C6 TaxID=3109366 RepID=UPI002DDCA08F|nr:hypothetical protein [Sedimentibacter sp. MB36-C1]WSI04728.1 hypothetical protein U8307_02790 [Sedimentibacter sp. MB36-C1]